jgi:hypothetical protein
MDMDTDPDEEMCTVMLMEGTHTGINVDMDKLKNYN